MTGTEPARLAAMATSTTKTDDREQWRARILRALSELQTDIPGARPQRAEADEPDAAEA